MKPIMTFQFWCGVVVFVCCSLTASGLGAQGPIIYGVPIPGCEYVDPAHGPSCPVSTGGDRHCNDAGDRGQCVVGCHPEGFEDWCRGKATVAQVFPCRGKILDLPDNVIQPYDLYEPCECVPRKARVDEVPSQYDPEEGPGGYVIDKHGNNVDEDCDGIVDDEECDGVDNDWNGCIDDARGSCVLRVWVAPFCWDGSMAKFEVEAQEEIMNFVRDVGISRCLNPRPPRPNKILIDYHDQELSMPYNCDIWDNQKLCEQSPFTLKKALEYAADQEFNNNPDLDEGSYDVIAFATDRHICNRYFAGIEVGSTNGLRWNRHVWYESLAVEDGGFQHPGVLAHELGHTLGLAEEYCCEGAANHGKGRCADACPNVSIDRPNCLDPDLDCDCTDHSWNSCCGNDADDYCDGNIGESTHNHRCNMGNSSHAGGFSSFCNWCDRWLKNPIDWLYNVPVGDVVGIRGKEIDLTKSNWKDLDDCPADPLIPTSCLDENGDPCINATDCNSNADCGGNTPDCHPIPNGNKIGVCVAGCNNDQDCDNANLNDHVCDTTRNVCVRDQNCNNAGGRVPMDCSFKTTGCVNAVKVSLDIYPGERFSFIEKKFYKGRIGLAPVRKSGRYVMEFVNEFDRVIGRVGMTSLKSEDERDDTSPWYNSFSIPISEDMTGDPEHKLKVRGLLDGVLVARTTFNGTAPIPDAGDDQLVECDQQGGAVVELDGSGTDDDGDMITIFEWSASGDDLDSSRSADPEVYFPLGNTTVELKVNDGSLVSEVADSIDITVIDTVAPQTFCVGDTQECVGELTPVTTTCTATDICDPAVTPVSTAEEHYPLGEHSFTCTASDESGNTDQSSCQVKIIDTTPPAILAPPQYHPVCVPNAAVVDLALPAVTDTCASDSSVELVGYLKTMNGHDAGHEEIFNDQIVVNPGVHVIEWIATDTAGNQATAEQVVTVEFQTGPECCTADQQFFEGNDDCNYFFHVADPSEDQSWCVFTHAGRDEVHIGNSDENYVALGEHCDYLHTMHGGSRVLGQDGHDTLLCHDSENRVYAGTGHDYVEFYKGSNTVYAGHGDDMVYGGWHDDVIIPGPGSDYVDAYHGNDTVIVYDVCELECDEVLIGGRGHDRLYLPVTLAEAWNLGVRIYSFEEVYTTDLFEKGYSECAQ